MKIAVMTHSLEGIGGIAKHVLYQCREMLAMGHEIDIWAVEYDQSRCYPELTKGMNITALRLPQPRTKEMYNVATGMRMLVYLQDLRKYYQEQQALVAQMPSGYDVINPHGNGIHWAAAAYKRKYDTPSIWMCNDYWPMTGQRHQATQGLGKKLKKAAKDSLVLPFDRLDRAAVRSMDEIVVLSERVKTQMQTHYGKINPVIIRTGIDTTGLTQGDGAALKAKFGLENCQFVLLTVAMLMPRRRLEDVIQAVRMLVDQGCDVGYLVVGRMTHTVSYTEFLQSEVAKHGLEDRVKFAGEVTETELRESYQASDAFIWPADENQSWGMACLEAMAAGKPAIVSKANGVAEVLENGKNGLVITPRNPDEIVSSVKTLIENPDLRWSIGKAGQSLVHNNYSWRSNAEAMLALFEKAGRP